MLRKVKKRIIILLTNENGGVKQMKKRLIILMALILGIMVVGCNKAETSEQSEGISQEYKDAMSKGKSNVI